MTFSAGYFGGFICGGRLKRRITACFSAESVFLPKSACESFSDWSVNEPDTHGSKLRSHTLDLLFYNDI